MKLSFKGILWLLIIPIILASCNGYKKIPYLQDAETITAAEFAASAKNYEATIMPKDILSITVNTPTGEASRDFNLPLIPQNAGDIVQTQISSAGAGHGSLQNYIVDNDGYINYPILGQIKIGGLTKSQAQDKIYGLIYPKYIKEKPIVSIRFLSYRVSVLGEVAKPGTYTATNEQMTFFEALANAGDLTIHGKRENVLLIRESADGERKLFRVNLQEKDVLLNNEIYYLQQNDKIYVSPNKAKGNNASFGTLESLALSGLSILISVIAIITR